MLAVMVIGRPEGTRSSYYYASTLFQPCSYGAETRPGTSLRVARRWRMLRFAESGLEEIRLFFVFIHLALSLSAWLRAYRPPSGTKISTLRLA